MPATARLSGLAPTPAHICNASSLRPTPCVVRARALQFLHPHVQKRAATTPRGHQRMRLATHAAPSSSDLAEAPLTFPGPFLAEYDLEDDGSLIGRGAYGTVIAARRKASGASPGCAPAARVAVKVLPKAGRRGSSPTSPGREERIAEEVAILRALKHVPEAVALIDVFETPSAFFLVTEMAAGGDLEAALRVSPAGTLPPSSIAAIAHDVLQVLAASHALGITHGDLKPANILLASPVGGVGDEDGAGVAARLGDFGCASRTNCGSAPVSLPSLPRATGTPLFLPPEALLLSKAGPAVDMYSLGAVLYLALTGRPPLPAPARTAGGAWVESATTARGPPSYTAVSPADLLTAMLGDEEVAFGGHPALDGCPEAASFLSRLLDADWEARPSAAEALAHPWLAGVAAARAGPRAAAAAARQASG